MKKADIQDGRKGFVILMDTLLHSPGPIYIDEVTIESIRHNTVRAFHCQNGINIPICLQPHEIYYTYEEAHKHVLRYLMKEYKKFKGVVA